MTKLYLEKLKLRDYFNYSLNLFQFYLEIFRTEKCRLKITTHHLRVWSTQMFSPIVRVGWQTGKCYKVIFSLHFLGYFLGYRGRYRIGASVALRLRIDFRGDLPGVWIVVRLGLRHRQHPLLLRSRTQRPRPIRIPPTRGPDPGTGSKYITRKAAPSSKIVSFGSLF